MNTEYSSYRSAESLALMKKLWQSTVSKDDTLIHKFKEDLIEFIKANWEAKFTKFGKEYDERYFKNGFFAFLVDEVNAYICQAQKQFHSKEEKIYHFGHWELKSPDYKFIGRLIGSYKGESGFMKCNLNYLSKTFLNIDWFSYELSYELRKIIDLYPNFVIILIQEWLRNAEAALRALPEEKTPLLVADPVSISAKHGEILTLINDLSVQNESQALSPITKKRFEEFIFRLPQIRLILDMRPSIVKHWAEDSIRHDVDTLRSEKRQRIRRLLWWLTPFLVVLAGVAMYGALKPKPRRPYTPAELASILVKPKTLSTGPDSTAPYSMEYHFNMGSVQEDTVFLEHTAFYTDDHNPKFILPEDCPANVQIFFPKPTAQSILLLNENKSQVLHESPLYITSKDWVSWVHSGSPAEEEPMQTLRSVITKDGRLHFDHSTRGQEVRVVIYCRYVPLGISADSCIVEYLYLNSEETKGISAYDCVVCFGEQELFKSGCVNTNKLGTSHYGGWRFGQSSQSGGGVFNVNRSVLQVTIDQHYGIENRLGTNLEKLCVDHTEPHKVRVETARPKFKVFVDDSLKIENTYKGSLGEFRFIRFGFRGVGWVDDVVVRNSKGEVVFEDHFEK